MSMVKVMIAISVIWVCSIGVLHAAHVSCGDAILFDTVLDSDLKACPNHGIFINGYNITLDCNGHSISGSRLPGKVGILINANGVTVKNCTVRDFDFGIMSNEGTHDYHVLFNTAQHNLSFGFNLNPGDNITLKANTSQWNDNHGFRLAGLTNSLIENNTSMRNGTGQAPVHGFRISDSSGNTFNQNTSHQNGGHGFRISDSSGNMFSENTGQRNGRHGFRVSESILNAFAMNTSANNGLDGFIIRDASNENMLSGNVSVNHKDGNGFQVLDSSGNSLMQNTAINNGNFDLADGSCPDPANIWEDNQFHTAECPALQ